MAAALALVAVLGGCVSSGERARPARAAQNAGAGGYVVKPGDTLSAIAARFGVGLTALASANALPPPYLIRVGQRLAVPRPGSAMGPRMESRPVVQPLPRETIPRETMPRDYGTPVPSPVYTPTQQPPPVQTYVGPAPRLVWPTDGPVSVPFGTGAEPRGLTFAAHKGAAVRAAAGGTVLFAGTEPNRYGQLVLIDHGNGWVTAYAHLSRIVVSEGDTVRSGARLGFVGASGAADEARLHFELRRDNQPVDPAPLLPPRFWPWPGFASNRLGFDLCAAR